MKNNHDTFFSTIEGKFALLKLHSDLSTTISNKHWDIINDLQKKHNKLVEIMMEANPELKSKLKRCCVKA
jgi:hypothetical protein